MSRYLRPKRGKKSTANTTLSESSPLKRGEVFFEVPDDGVGSGKGAIKIGDGSSAYEDLPYFINGENEDIKHITYAQYQQLTPEEKNDGTIRFVNDYPVEDNTVVDITEAQLNELIRTQSYDPNILYNVIDVSDVQNIIDDTATTDPDVAWSAKKCNEVKTALNDSLTNKLGINDSKFNNNLVNNSIYDTLKSNSLPIGLYFYSVQNAVDNPGKGNVSFAIIHKATANGTYSNIYLFIADNIKRAATLGTLPESLTWTTIAGT